MPTTLTLPPPQWTVRLVKRGELYGRDDCLTHDKDEPMVEFYDSRQAKELFSPLGQFVSRYYLSTILDRKPGPLRLDAGVPDWTVSADDMKNITNWLEAVK